MCIFDFNHPNLNLHCDSSGKKKQHRKRKPLIEFQELNGGSGSAARDLIIKRKSSKRVRCCYYDGVILKVSLGNVMYESYV